MRPRRRGVRTAIGQASSLLLATPHAILFPEGGIGAHAHAPAAGPLSSILLRSES